MYTKALLILVFLIIIPSMISDASSKHSNTGHAKILQHNLAPIPTGGAGKNNDEMPWGLAEQRHSMKSTGSHHGEEDGKHHHFHFTRFEKRRAKKLWRIISKSLLLLVHLAILVSLFLQHIH